MKMKKLLALLMAMVMVFSLVACGSSDNTPATDSTQPSESQTPAESTPAESTPVESEGFVWNGQKEVWSILPTTQAQGLVWINDAIGAVMEAQGFTYVKKDAQGNPGTQVQFVEQAISAGNVGALMIAAMSVEMLQDVVEQAIDAGIAVAYLGAEPTEYTIAGCVYTAYEITGMYAVQAAEHWVTNSGANVPQNADGKYEIAIDTYYDIADGVYRSNAIKGTAEKSEVLALVSETSAYGQDGSLTVAFNNAQAVLNANPDCHIFVAYEPEQAMGIANAIADYCEQTGGDLADYCVIPCYAEDTTFTAMYEAALADPSASAVKGYSTYGDAALPLEMLPDAVGVSAEALAAFSEELNPGVPVCIPPLLTGEHLADILLSACGIEGYDWEYGATYYDTITAVNTAGFEATWSMGDANPAAEYKK